MAGDIARLTDDESLCHRRGQKASTRTATGEMGMHDIQPGGEYYEWAQEIEKAAKEIQKLTKNGIRFQEMRPFDNYQGPYARMSPGKLWSAEEEGMFILTNIPQGPIDGYPEEIAEIIMAKFKKASDGCEERTAAETKLVCNRCGKTLPPIKGYEKASWRHCPCGGVATVKKASSTVAVSADRDLGYTVWFGKQHEDVYAKTREEAKHKGAKALGTTPDKVRVEMFDTNPRGNSTASEIDMAASRRGRLAYADPAELADLPRMTLNQIAGLIYDDWKSVNYAARPYLDAMTTLQNVSDMYMQDSGTSVVAYFLSNASSWKGEVAKAVKKELQRRIRR